MVRVLWGALIVVLRLGIGLLGLRHGLASRLQSTDESESRRVLMKMISKKTKTQEGDEIVKKLLLTLISTLFCALVLASTTFAHGGMEHVMGTVTGITDHSISVKVSDGTVTSVEVDGETKFLKGDAAATVKDVQVGSRVVIHAHKHDNSLHAAEVKIGTNAGQH